MENKRYTGIVLQARFPVKRVIVILDSALGKIEAVPGKETVKHLASGFLISYQLDQWRSIWVAQAIEVIAIPALWVRYDIDFMHQLIELCLLYSPFNQTVPLVFEVLDLIYKDLAVMLDLWKKKILLCKLLLLLDLYPEASIISLYKNIYCLIHLPVEAIFSLHYPAEYITLELDIGLSKWLENALLVTQEHKQLKTFSFGSVRDG